LLNISSELLGNLLRKENGFVFSAAFGISGDGTYGLRSLQNSFQIGLSMVTVCRSNFSDRSDVKDVPLFIVCVFLIG